MIKNLKTLTENTVLGGLQGIQGGNSQNFLPKFVIFFVTLSILCFYSS